jgi:hypothetical protein
VKSTKETTHAFIIRIWIEPQDIKDAAPIWRGVIEHVGSGTRVYFNRVEQIIEHLIPYFEAMGVNADKSAS